MKKYNKDQTYSVYIKYTEANTRSLVFCFLFYRTKNSILSSEVISVGKKRNNTFCPEQVPPVTYLLLECGLLKEDPIEDFIMRTDWGLCLKIASGYNKVFIFRT